MNPIFKTFSRTLAFSLASCLLITGCGKNENKNDQPDQVYEVVRGDFNIVVSATGFLDAVKRYLIEAPSVSRQGLDIIEAVPDQSVLQKGDVIVAFSQENYNDQLEEQTLKIEEAEKNLLIMQQDYQMKVADIVSAIKNSTDSLRSSRQTMEKYNHEDAPLEKDSLEQQLSVARQNLKDEEENLAALKANLLAASMGDEGARTQLENQVASSELKIKDLENKAEKASYNLRIFKQYTYPQRSRQLQQDLVKSEMNLQKQLVNSAAQRVQLERKIETQKRLIVRLKQQKQDLLDNISMLRVTAPVSGTITYGNPDPRRRNREQTEIIAGTSMRPREVIGSIPDMSKLIVNVDIPEISRSKIEPGMRAEMRIKALPNLQLSGEVEKITDMATNLNTWDTSSPKIYPTVIKLDQTDRSLRPGMTVEIDMISEVVSDVLYVPVEALFVKEGNVYCYVKQAVGMEQRQVHIGKSSTSYVEIVDGIAEGDRVMLSREES